MDLKLCKMLMSKNTKIRIYQTIIYPRVSCNDDTLGMLANGEPGCN
jgi:hypothetical protein